MVKTSDATFFFPAGHYAAQAIVLQGGPGARLQNIELSGEQGAVLHLSGTPTAIGGLPAGVAVGIFEDATGYQNQTLGREA